MLASRVGERYSPNPERQMYYVAGCWEQVVAEYGKLGCDSQIRRQSVRRVALRHFFIDEGSGEEGV